MKRILIIVLLSILVITGCNKKSMNYITQNEPSIEGSVEEVHDKYILIRCDDLEGYPQSVKCSVLAKRYEK